MKHFRKHPEEIGTKMKIERLRALLVGATMIVGASAQAEELSAYPPGGKSTSIPASQLKFSDTGARGVDGKTKIEFADVYGNMTTGRHGSFFTFTPGFVSPVHSHTYDYYAVVLKGEVANYQPGEKPIKLGPGSYWYQVGKQAHITACYSKTPCEIFIVQSSKFDAQIPPVTE